MYRFGRVNDWRFIINIFKKQVGEAFLFYFIFRKIIAEMTAIISPRERIVGIRGITLCADIDGFVGWEGRWKRIYVLG